MKQQRAGDACDSAISLTARGHASMLVLATGSDHLGRGVAALDWALLARAEATLDERVVATALRAL
jgi:siroheme synthase